MTEFYKAQVPVPSFSVNWGLRVWVGLYPIQGPPGETKFHS